LLRLHRGAGQQLWRGAYRLTRVTDPGRNGPALSAPVLSIVIPSLSEAAIVRQRLIALQGLRGADHELILADGGSTDGTPELAMPLVDRLLSVPSGRAWQMNAGAGAARGQVLWFLHLDSEVPGGAAELVLAAADSAGWGRFDVRLSGGRLAFRIIERMMNLRSCLTGIVTGDQGMFVRRELFLSMGGFPAIPLMEDVALSRRLLRHGRPACLAPPLVTSSRRWERYGVLRTLLLMWYLRLAYFLGASPERLARLYPTCGSLPHGS
jgi:rSAM/selenodomain-associated transferase 2